MFDRSVPIFPANDAVTPVDRLRSQSDHKRLEAHLPEILQIEQLLQSNASSSILGRVEASVTTPDGMQLPIYSLTLGCQEPSAPVVILTAGMHGIERIGSEVLLGFLSALAERVQWDVSVQSVLAKVHLVAIPVVNPGGMLRRKRANLAGVDLNRNAPVNITEEHARARWPLTGQRLSRYLPWYRGGEGLEPENQVLHDLVHRVCADRPLALSLDIHSGFGTCDRIWFPYAFSRKPIACLAEIKALQALWGNSYPHHNYRFEPQSNHYLTHGDMWDFLHLELQSALTFLPLTLELGSWNWLRKRPRQLFNRLGLFHPLVPHRRQRAVRDHQTLLHFLLSALASADSWLPKSEQQREQWRCAAMQQWYNDNNDNKQH